MTTLVTEVQPADADSAVKHFASLLVFETDCWDVHDSLKDGDADFVLLDVRSESAYGQAHIAGAVSRPHATITEDSMTDYPADTIFVVYCSGPHCNGAHRAALRLAQLGRPVKIMIGGITGWLDEGFELTSALE